MLPGSLLENELFGHARGAFTGAGNATPGLVAAAEGGTLFLDEVDAFDPVNQVKMLRFLQEREYRPLGDTRVRKANLRVVAATNVELEQAVREGWFRADLFFRLRVVPICVPPLCERPDDIEELIDTYATRFAHEHRLPRVQLDAAAHRRLLTYAWPGNVRELVNCIEYLTLLRLDRPVEPGDLQLVDLAEAEAAAEPPTSLPFAEAKKRVVMRFEREYLTDALRRAHGNITRAAGLADKDRRAFFELLRKHQVGAAEFRARPGVPRRVEPEPRGP